MSAVHHYNPFFLPEYPPSQQIEDLQALANYIDEYVQESLPIYQDVILEEIELVREFKQKADLAGDGNSRRIQALFQSNLDLDLQMMHDKQEICRTQVQQFEEVRTKIVWKTSAKLADNRLASVLVRQAKKDLAEIRKVHAALLKEAQQLHTEDTDTSLLGGR